MARMRIHEPEATTFTPLEFDLCPHLQLVLQLGLAGVERSSIVDPVVILGMDHTGFEGPGPVDPDVRHRRPGSSTDCDFRGAVTNTTRPSRAQDQRRLAR